MSAGLAEVGRVDSRDNDNVMMTVCAGARMTRRERRAAARRESRSVVRSQTVIGTAIAAALSGKTPTVPRALGRFVIHEQEGALGGAGFAGNSRVVLTCQLESDPRSARPQGGRGEIETFETKDPYDRAHSCTTLSTSFQRELVATARGSWRRSNSGEMERCARAVPVPGAKPRRYPRSSMLASGISIDSQWDWWHEARKRLAGVPGVGVDDGDDEVRGELMGVRVRDLIRRRIG